MFKTQLEKLSDEEEQLFPKNVQMIRKFYFEKIKENATQNNNAKNNL